MIRSEEGKVLGRGLFFCAHEKGSEGSLVDSIGIETSKSSIIFFLNSVPYRNTSSFYVKIEFCTAVARPYSTR